ncbi:MAG TPA: carbohydrate binding family 9 domain-containing protein, partial [Nitrospiria bacterium]|nr:carbohydrate binding family 9 domain-containing protein [Nitrospiria bacterium]
MSVARSRKLSFPIFPALAVGFFFCLVPFAAFSEEPSKKTIMAHPVERGAITVDGRLDEPAWRQYPPVSGFVQLTPKTGEPEEGKTDVWILYDDQYLYVGAAMTDPEPAQIQADERRRDSTFSRSDTFGFVVDPFHDHQNGFFFETNPFGAKSDGLVSQEGAFVNMDWDGLWDVAAERTLEGWSAEFRIPLETLRYQKGEKQVWGIQFRRQVPHLKQISFWNPMTTEQTFFMISKGGHLEGINPSASESKLFIKPYV